MHRPINRREGKPGTIVGTVMDVNGDTVAGATVVLENLDANNGRPILTSDSGYFSFVGVNPGVPYQISIMASDFANWTSAAITLQPGQYKIVDGIQMRIATGHSEIQVTYNPAQAARQEYQTQVHQRVLGIVRNFYVAYTKAQPRSRQK